jgi:ABC-2 type transport system ATP-binding protein
MNAVSELAPAVHARDLRKSFRRETGEIVKALDGISLDVKTGTLAALVGPDGAGKTTFIRLIAGLMPADAGMLTVLGTEVRRDPQTVQDRIGYMPQKFGLYEDLSVQENLDLYADLHGIGKAERAQRYPELFAMTALEPFTARLAGRLSGGMKQKLGLACTLIGSPSLLLLDEPTVGVDPLSRRELWEIIRSLVEQQHLTVLISTSYLDEAEHCHEAFVLREGKVLAQGSPASVSALADGHVFRVVPPPGQAARDLQARLLDAPGTIDAVPEGGRVRLVRAEAHGVENNAVPIAARFEDGFMTLLKRSQQTSPTAETMSFANRVADRSDIPVIRVKDLLRTFGSFTAVDHISFEVRAGEIFGLLGPNGAGKTTTFRMLCGLLPATAGTLDVAGFDLRRARASARQRIGYVAQKFALYGQLTVTQNLEFFASAYGLEGARKRERVGWALDQFELRALMHLPSGQLPGGYKQRLAMAAALLHEPDILFLDEPTSGADPLARREFWRRITALSSQGVTVIVTTHFMEEAEYCDRIAILDGGRILAQGTPAEVRGLAPATAEHEPDMEDAFIAVVAQARDHTHDATGHA